MVDQILRINNSEDLATVKNRMSRVIKVALQVGADVQNQKYQGVAKPINYSAYDRTQSVNTTS